MEEMVEGNTETVSINTEELVEEGPIEESSIKQKNPKNWKRIFIISISVLLASIIVLTSILIWVSVTYVPSRRTAVFDLSRRTFINVYMICLWGIFYTKGLALSPFQRELRLMHGKEQVLG